MHRCLILLPSRLPRSPSHCSSMSLAASFSFFQSSPGEELLCAWSSLPPATSPSAPHSTASIPSATAGSASSCLPCRAVWRRMAEERPFVHHVGASAQLASEAVVVHLCALAHAAPLKLLCLLAVHLSFLFLPLFLPCLSVICFSLGHEQVQARSLAAAATTNTEVIAPLPPPSSRTATQIRGIHVPKPTSPVLRHGSGFSMSIGLPCATLYLAYVRKDNDDSAAIDRSDHPSTLRLACMGRTVRGPPHEKPVFAGGSSRSLPSKRAALTRARALARRPPSSRASTTTAFSSSAAAVTAVAIAISVADKGAAVLDGRNG